MSSCLSYSIIQNIKTYSSVISVYIFNNLIFLWKCLTYRSLFGANLHILWARLHQGRGCSAKPRVLSWRKSLYFCACAEQLFATVLRRRRNKNYYSSVSQLNSRVNAFSTLVFAGVTRLHVNSFSNFTTIIATLAQLRSWFSANLLVKLTKCPYN